MGAESQKSGYQESLKSLKKLLTNRQESPADLAFGAQFGETHPEARCLVWGDFPFRDTAQFGETRLHSEPMQTT